MSYTIETVNSYTKKFLFSFNEVSFDKEINHLLQEKKKTSHIKGFRKGKAPLHMIQKLYGVEIQRDALYHFISSKIMEALEKEKIRVMGKPQLTNSNYEDEKKLRFEAVIQHIPHLEFTDLGKLSFIKKKEDISNEDMKEAINHHLEGKAEMVVSEETILSKGKFAVINFEGVKGNGERPENMKGEEFLLEVGSNTFIPGFEEGLVGMKVGKKKELPLTFPESYHVEDLKGQEVTFYVELLEIKEKKTPDITDELARELDYDSKEDMEKKIRVRLEYQKEKVATENLNGDILDKIIAEYHFDLPQVLIEEQINSLRGDIAKRLQTQKFNDIQIEEYFEKWSKDIEKKAAHQVRSGLILNTLAEKYSIDVNEDDFIAKCEEMNRHSGLSIDEIKAFYENNTEDKKTMMYGIREEKVFQEIYKEVSLEVQ